MSDKVQTRGMNDSIETKQIPFVKKRTIEILLPKSAADRAARDWRKLATVTAFD